MTWRHVRRGERIPVPAKDFGVVLREATEDGVLFRDGDSVWFVGRKDAKKMLKALDEKVAP